MRYWQPLRAITPATYSLPHPQNEHQQSVNSIRSRMFRNEGIAWIFAYIPELLTALIRKKTTYQRHNTGSKLIDIAHCKTPNNLLLVVENAILIRYY